MVYVPPEDATAARRPEIIPLPFPETIPEKISAPVQTIPAPMETIPTLPVPTESSPPKTIIQKPVETTPFFPGYQKRSLETSPCSIPKQGHEITAIRRGRIFIIEKRDDRDYSDET
ncbi:hypothetical protein NPIL_479021 [Nephila pilipes]|uniref:Uncharacterized protein n=1 Tax=Nephila pilipes TaxID=299642 RepID=A0A8X6Q6J3_NEPPI|nr:hypothetical protein NPIL_479021 [Nephila pilipes]